MSAYLIAYGTGLVALVILDIIWIGAIAKGFYKSALGQLIAEKPNFLAGAIFYLVYPIGVIVFAVAPALDHGGWSHALMYGLLFGFFNYATYDLTNWALIKGWPASPLGFDLPWGTALTGVVAILAYYAATLL